MQLVGHMGHRACCQPFGYGIISTCLPFAKIKPLTIFPRPQHFVPFALAIALARDALW